jgi:formate hydrogenlyase transcriptional activator
VSCHRPGRRKWRPGGRAAKRTIGHIPPLRDRQEDIPRLVRHFVQHFAQRMKKNIETVPSETMDTVLSRQKTPLQYYSGPDLLQRL